jgi:hypothetical protein
LRRAAALLGAAVLGPVFPGCGASEPRTRPGGDFTLEQAQKFEAFPLYFAGAQVDGLPLTALVRREDTADYVSFIYGDCVPASPDEGCAPPLEIQVWPSRTRGAGSYDSRPGAQVPERTTIEGRCAAYLGETQVEIYEPRSTIVVFSGSRERLRTIAAALRPLGAAPRGGGEAPVC